MDIKDTLTLSDIQKEVDDWIKEFGVRYFNELTNMAILTEEEFYDKPVTKELLRQATEKIKKQVDDLRLQLNDILQQKGVKRRPRTKKEMEKIKRYNERQKTLAKELAKQQSSQEDSE